MFVYYINNSLDRLHFLTNVVLEVVKDNGDGHHVEDVQFLRFVQRLHVDEQIVLRRQVSVISHVVHNLFQSMFANHVVFNTGRCGLPFKMI